MSAFPAGYSCLLLPPLIFLARSAREKHQTSRIAKIRGRAHPPGSEFPLCRRPALRLAGTGNSQSARGGNGRVQLYQPLYRVTARRGSPGLQLEQVRADVHQSQRSRPWGNPGRMVRGIWVFASVVRLIAEEVIDQRGSAGLGNLRRQPASALVCCNERDAEVLGLAGADPAAQPAAVGA
jgi:hypothetical protein